MIKFSKDTRNIARDIIVSYSHWNRLDEQFTINFDDIDLCDLKKLSASIMLDDEGHKFECFSTENPYFEQSLNSIVTSMFKNKDEIDSLIINSVVNYQRKIIESLLEESLIDYNYDMRDVA